MKIRLIIFAVFLIVVSSLVLANNDPCEKFTTPLDLASCLGNQLKIAESALQKAEDQFLTVIKSMPDDFHFLEYDFRKSNDAWRKNRDRNCSLESNILYPPLPDIGRANDLEKSMVYSRCMIEETGRRIQTVERWCLEIETWKNIDLP